MPAQSGNAVTVARMVSRFGATRAFGNAVPQRTGEKRWSGKPEEDRGGQRSAGQTGLNLLSEILCLNYRFLEAAHSSLILA